MKYGLISLDFRRFPLEYSFQMARRYGFDGVEIWAGRPHAYPADLDADAIAAIRSWRRKYGVEIPMYTGNFLGSNFRITSADSRERAEAVALYKRHIDAACTLEIPRTLVVADHAACLGAAILAGYAVGIFNSVQGAVESMVRLRKRYSPNPENHAVYLRQRAKYNRLFKSLEALFEEDAAD